MEKKWYVVHTYSGYEQKVKEGLEETHKNEQDGGAVSARSSFPPK